MRRFAFVALAVAALMVACVSAAESPEWSIYRKNLKAMRVGDKTLGDALGAFLDYEFTLPLEYMRRSQVGVRVREQSQVHQCCSMVCWEMSSRVGSIPPVLARTTPTSSPPKTTTAIHAPHQSYTGPRTRLRRVMTDMLAGNKVEVAVLGGSVSAGAIASRKQAAVDPNDVWSLVRLELQNHVSPKIEFYNNARSATKSYIASLCLNRFLNSTADLVFVEFIANDGSEMDTQLQGPLDKTRSFERFLRKIQNQPNNPAVVMMQMLVSEMAYPPEGKNGKSKRAFFSTPEDSYGNLAQYYDIPAVSFRCVLFRQIEVA